MLPVPQSLDLVLTFDSQHRHVLHFPYYLLEKQRSNLGRFEALLFSNLNQQRGDLLLKVCGSLIGKILIENIEKSSWTERDSNQRGTVFSWNFFFLS